MLESYKQIVGYDEPREIISNVYHPESHRKISVSEIYSLLRCLKQHDYSYRQGLRTKDTPDYFTKGSFLHAMLAEVLEAVKMIGKPTKIDFNAVSRHILEGWDGAGRGYVSEEDRLWTMHSLEQFIEGTDWDNIVIKSLEEEFYVDIGLVDDVGEPVLVHGFIDALVTDKETGDLWIVEHKTAKRAWSSSQFALHLQPIVYALVVHALTGTYPIGTLYNFFYPKGFQQKNKFITEPELLQVLQETQNAVSLRETGLVIRAPKWGCNDCFYKVLCTAELQGGDTTVLREAKYKVDESKVEEKLNDD